MVNNTTADRDLCFSFNSFAAESTYTHTHTLKMAESLNYEKKYQRNRSNILSLKQCLIFAAASASPFIRIHSVRVVCAFE